MINTLFLRVEDPAELLAGVHQLGGGLDRHELEEGEGASIGLVKHSEQAFSHEVILERSCQQEWNNVR